MVINFRIDKISQDVYKIAQIFILIIIKKKKTVFKNSKQTGIYWNHDNFKLYYFFKTVMLTVLKKKKKFSCGLW